MSPGTNTHPIEKEAIAQLRFPEKEVLNSDEDRRNREINLQRALSLGNLEKSKARIVFEDESGKKSVETTVWGITDKRIILKQGIHIPIHRIHEVIV